MTGPHFNAEDPDNHADDADVEDAEDTEDGTTRPVSVAELLAKNGSIGSPPVTGRRRRRRGSDDSVSVAELTGEIPIITDDEDETQPPQIDEDGPDSHVPRANGAARAVGTSPPPSEDTDEPSEDADEPSEDAADHAVNWSDPGPRWPESPPQQAPGPELKRSPYPLPRRKADRFEDERARSGAEQMSPDPDDDYLEAEVDVMDTDVRDAELPTEDSAFVRSLLRAPRKLFGKRRSADPAPDEEVGETPDGEVLGDDAELDDAELGEELGEDEPGELAEYELDAPGEDQADIETDPADEPERVGPEALGTRMLRGGWAILQSILAVAFGAGLFIAFDQLWKWNNIVALVLCVLVTLGLVAAVSVVRKTTDTISTLIAVAVGLLITLGPLALLRTG